MAIGQSFIVLVAAGAQIFLVRMVIYLRRLGVVYCRSLEECGACRPPVRDPRVLSDALLLCVAVALITSLAQWLSLPTRRVTWRWPLWSVCAAGVAAVASLAVMGITTMPQPWCWSPSPGRYWVAVGVQALLLAVSQAPLMARARPAPL